MKRAIIAILITLFLTAQAWASGTSTVTAQKVNVVGQNSRMVLTVTWVDDTAGTTASINPVTYGIEGWYLYSAETNPGATAPTDNYDITIVDADSVDLAGGVLLNRDQTNTEIVNVGTAAHGYPVMRSTVTWTLSGNSVNGATGTCILTFIAN